MARNPGRRLQGATTLEKAVYAVLVLVLLADIGLIVFARAEDDAPPATSERPATPAATDEEPAGETTAAEEPAGRTTAGETTTADAAPADGALPPCAEVEDPAPDSDPVQCRTRSATLTIAGEERPLVLGATQVRLFGATLRGPTVVARVRVRNETDAEQGVLAGGQEIYVNLDGLRIDADPVGDVRVPAMEAANVRLRFALTPARLRKLQAAGGRAELGVRPWDEGAGGSPGTVVGVIRFRAQSAA
jgi:hypothetical protein